MIELVRISTGYPGEPKVLSDLSFTFSEDEVYMLMGASGRGKTTLLRVMAGLIIPSSGQIKGMFDKRVGILFQENRLLPWCTVLQNVLLGMKKSSIDDAIYILNKLELADNYSAFPDSLSGGMQRRVALARAIGYAPDILLLDEPFAGVDQELVYRIAPFVRKAARMVLFTSHVPEEGRMMQADVLHLTSESSITRIPF